MLEDNQPKGLPMNKSLLILLVTILAVSTWLAVDQRALHRELQYVRMENARLMGELARKADSTANDLANARRQLSQAQASLAAMEQRNTVQPPRTDAPRIQTRLGPRSGGMALGGLPATAIIDSSDLVLDLGERQQLPALKPSTSHASDGQQLHRSWGPEQVIGAPDTAQAGDFATAWAPRSSSGGDEWLHVNYAQPVDVAEVIVRETHNPGAISKVAAVLPNGQEVTIWEGTEPQAQAPVDMSFPMPKNVQAGSVKIYLDRRRAPGWNEIDAVELVGRNGSRQWAISATASSSFAEP